MKNCLVTKYKKSASNKELVTLGGVKFNLPIASTSVFSCNCTKVVATNGSFNIENSSGTTLATNVTTYDNPTNATIRVRAYVDNTIVNILDKYEGPIYMMGVGSTQDIASIDLDTLNYCKCFGIGLGLALEGYGTLDVSTITLIDPANGGLRVYIKDSESKVIVPSGFMFENLKSFMVASNNHLVNVVKCNVGSLANCTSLTDLDLQNSAEVAGNLDGLFTAMKAAGKTNRLTCFLSGTSCTVTIGGVTKTLTLEDAVANGYGIYVDFSSSTPVVTQGNTAPWN